MTVAFFLLAATQPKLTLRLYSNQFVVSDSSRPSAPALERISLTPSAKTATPTAAFRRDQVFVVWDERGLTVREGKHSMTTRLREIATSPRLRSHEDIAASLQVAREAGVKLGASALSGYRRIGKDVFLLPRWQTSPGHTWMEALVKIDLSEESPRPQALAILPGITFSAADIEDNLQLTEGRLVALIHKGSSWGRWMYDPRANQATFFQAGGGIKFAKATGPGTASFIEKTPEGFVAGRLDLATGERTNELESRGPFRFLDLETPSIAVAEEDNGSALLNLETGARFALPDGNTQVRRAKKGILVWEGGTSPVRAWLLNPNRWKPLAWWSRTPA